MPRWEYMAITAWNARTVDTEAKKATWRWSWSVSKAWADIYRDVVAEANATEDVYGLWSQLGDDGWELVSCLDVRRDQFSDYPERVDGQGTYQQIYGVVTVCEYVFKRAASPRHR